MYERHHEPLLPLRQFVVRVLRHAGVTLSLVIVSLLIGMVGYHFLSGLNWVDAYVNATMILAGMGPVDPLPSNAAKLFAGTYALFSGLIFVASAGILFAPIIHRLFHRFHIESEDAGKRTDD
jgi:hypothetical protein